MDKSQKHYADQEDTGNSLAVQWLGLRASTAGGRGLIPGQGTKILHAVWHGQKKKKEKTRKNVYSVTAFI